MSRNPYERIGQTPRLRRSVFAFIDMLGYAEMIRRAIDASSQQDLLKRIHEALTEGRALLEDTFLSEESKSLVEDDGFALRAFTDNIVIGWPIYDDAEMELGLAFSTLALFQLKMAEKGFFVRGALSVGSAYIDDIAVPGDALVEAYNGETMLARDPRIILTASAVEAVRKHLTYYARRKEAPQWRELLCDSDGQWFLNYLECVVPEYNNQEPAYTDLLLHKAAVEKELRENQSKPAIWSKYAWVARYHNYLCDLYPRLFRAEHRIKLGRFRSSPSRIC